MYQLILIFYDCILQLSELNFEMAHQRVQLQGTVAESESKAALMRETLQEKVSEGHTPAGLSPQSTHGHQFYMMPQSPVAASLASWTILTSPMCKKEPSFLS